MTKVINKQTNKKKNKTKAATTSQKKEKTKKSITATKAIKKEKLEKEKKQNKKTSITKSKAISKPKYKKEYDEDDIDLLEKDDIINEEEEIVEVEEIDINNIEPIISESEPLLEDGEEEEYVPKTRGRKKQVQPEVHHQQTMEEIIRNRPLQIDPTQKNYVVKNDKEPKPYIVHSKSSKERYSDKELQEFKEIILQKLKETKENYDQLKKYFTHEDDNGIDDTSPTFKMIEDGSGVMTKEEIEQQLARLEKYMIDLQNALLRIENKTYGICTVTGKLIPKERLRSVPHATKSIEVKINRND